MSVTMSEKLRHDPAVRQRAKKTGYLENPVFLTVSRECTHIFQTVFSKLLQSLERFALVLSLQYFLQKFLAIGTTMDEFLESFFVGSFDIF